MELATAYSFYVDFGAVISSPVMLLSKNGGAFATPAGTITQIGSTSTWVVALTAADTNFTYGALKITAAGIVARVYPMETEHLATAAEITDAVWDEVLTGATHNIASSAGRRVRQLGNPVVWDGIARGAGINGNQIQLDTGASAVSGSYDPSLIAIVGGTGTGQCRLILQYEGSTRMATVDRAWRVNPDATSEFIVYAHPGREHVNEGLAQAGGTATITLNASASDLNGNYIGQTVFIRSGTGEDQVRVVTGFNGTTKVATVTPDWGIVPDTTSAYVMLPVHIHEPSEVATAVRTELATELARIDAAVSTRLPTASYTAPDNTSIAAIQAKTDLIPAGGVPDAAYYTPTRAGKIDFLDASVASRLATAGYTAPDNADIALIKAATDNLPADPASNTQVNTRVATADTRLANLDATISSRASQVSVDGLQLNTAFQVATAGEFIIPPTGTTVYKIFVYTFDGTGTPADPDANTINLTIKHPSGTDIVPLAAMTRTAAGQYSADYSVASTWIPEANYLVFDYAISATAFQQVRVVNAVTVATDVSSSVAAIKAKTDLIPAAGPADASSFTPARAVKLDQLDAAVSSRLATVGYTNPDNTSILDIKAKTDGLHFSGDNVDAIIASRGVLTDYATSTEVGTRLPTAPYGATIDDIETKVTAIENAGPVADYN